MGNRLNGNNIVDAPSLVRDNGFSDPFVNVCAALGWRPRSLVAVLTAYLDESYNQRTVKNPNDSLVYTVGCWVSTCERWKRFGKEWRSALRSAGLEWFHMSEYESRLNDYQDWTELKRVGVLKRLHRIIKSNVLYGITSSVNCADYDKLYAGDLRAAFGKTYYGFNVRVIMKGLAEWADATGYDGQIHYVFAELKGQGNELDTVFRRSLANPEMKKLLRLDGMWAKGLMRDVRQLQAADILAYELNKRCVNHVTAGKKFARKSLENLAGSLYGDRLAPLYCGEKELKHWLRLLGG